MKQIGRFFFLSLVTTLAAALWAGAAVIAEAAKPEIFESGDFRYTVADGQATIVGYNGEGGDVVFPGQMGGYPVTAIAIERVRLTAHDRLTSIMLTAIQ